MPAFSAEYGRLIRTAVSRGLVAAPLFLSSPSCGPEPTNRPTGTSSGAPTEQVGAAPTQVSRVEWQGIVERHFEVKGRIELPEGKHLALEDLAGLQVAFSGEYIGEGEGGRSAIVLASLDGYIVDVLTSELLVAEDPVWLDEENLIISLNKEGEDLSKLAESDPELYRLNLSYELGQLTHDEYEGVFNTVPPEDTRPVVSPSKRFVVFQRQEELEDWQDPIIAVLDLQAGQIKKIDLPRFETFSDDPFADISKAKIARVVGTVFTPDEKYLLVVRNLHLSEDRVVERRGETDVSMATPVDVSTYIVQVVDVEQGFRHAKTITIGTLDRSTATLLGVSLDGQFLGFDLGSINVDGTFAVHLDREEVFAVDKGAFVGMPYATSNGQYHLIANVNQLDDPVIFGLMTFTGILLAKFRLLILGRIILGG